MDQLLFTLNEDELEELKRPSGGLLSDEDEEDCHLFQGKGEEEEDRTTSQRQRKESDSVDWELTLSLETTLQLIEGEPTSGDGPEELIQRILDVCRGRGGLPEHLRGKVWLILLGLYCNQKSTKHSLIEIYDLKEQNELRKDCQEFVASTYHTTLQQTPLEHSSLTSTLESILTSYLKHQKLSYDKIQVSGHLAILKPLLTLISGGLSDTQLYNAFRMIITQYVPRDVLNEHGLPFHIFRLLLLYHEPEVCSVLDSLRVLPFAYASQWFLSLFSSAIHNLQSVLVLWDVYLQYRDPFLIYHMALVLVLNAKDRLLQIKQDPTSETSADKKQLVISLLSSLPTHLDPSDIPDFLTISQHYASQTPNSYRRMFESALYGNDSFLTLNSSSTTSPCRRVAMQSLCLPVSAEELLNSIRMAKSLSSSNESTDSRGSSSDAYMFVRFFVVDCRPADQYNSGRLPTAFHLDCALMLLEPVKFNTAVQGLLLAQKDALSVGAAAGGEHLCFVGSGREEEDQYVNMVVASFLQRNTQKVALLSGGYQALHELLYPDNIEDGLADHNPTTCPECILVQKNSTTSPTSSSGSRDGSPASSSESSNNKSKLFTAKLSLFSSTLKQKSAEMKGKLIDYINNPAVSSSTGGGGSDERHVKATDKNKSKPYRNLLPVFMIDDEGDGSSGKEGRLEGNSPDSDPFSDTDDSLLLPGATVRSIKAFLKRHSHHWWSCSEVLSDGSHYEGYVVVTKDNLFMIREMDNRDTGEVSLNRLLNSIIKITSKKKHPELITFKYGHVVKLDKRENNSGGAEEGKGQGGDEETAAEITHSDRFYLPTGSKDFVACVKKFIDSKASAGGGD